MKKYLLFALLIACPFKQTNADEQSSLFKVITGIALFAAGVIGAKTCYKKSQDLHEESKAIETYQRQLNQLNNKTVLTSAQQKAKTALLLKIKKIKDIQKKQFLYKLLTGGSVALSFVAACVAAWGGIELLSQKKEQTPTIKPQTEEPSIRPTCRTPRPATSDSEDTMHIPTPEAPAPAATTPPVLVEPAAPVVAPAPAAPAEPIVLPAEPATAPPAPAPPEAEPADPIVAAPVAPALVPEEPAPAPPVPAAVHPLPAPVPAPAPPVPAPAPAPIIVHAAPIPRTPEEELAHRFTLGDERVKEFFTNRRHRGEDLERYRTLAGRHAIRNKNEDLLRFVLSPEHHYRAELPAKNQSTFLHESARHGFVEGARFLLKEKHVDPDASPESSLEFSWPLCEVAKHNGNVELAKLLIDHGAKIRYHDFNDRRKTALHQAIEKSHFSLAKTLRYHVSRRFDIEDDRDKAKKRPSDYMDWDAYRDFLQKKRAKRVATRLLTMMKPPESASVDPADLSKAPIRRRPAFADIEICFADDSGD